MRPRPSWRWRSLRATTLVEAVLGMALLGTLLTAVVVAHGRFSRQAGQARRSVEACRLADQLLEDLWQRRNELYGQDEGDVPGHDGWRWRKVDVPTEDSGLLQKLRAKIIAVEVFCRGDATASNESLPNARVELLMPADEPPGGQP